MPAKMSEEEASRHWSISMLELGAAAARVARGKKDKEIFVASVSMDLEAFQNALKKVRAMPCRERVFTGRLCVHATNICEKLTCKHAQPTNTASSSLRMQAHVQSFGS